MAENSKIEWTNHTFNPWVGCTKISPACDNCYAEQWAKRSGLVQWGGDRRRTSAANWSMPVKWDKEARIAGERRKVFCASLADVFDAEIDPIWRENLFSLIDLTPNLDWLLLTKRPKIAADYFSHDVVPRNVWVGTTAEDQKHFDIRWPHLSRIQCAVRFISYEPALGALSVSSEIIKPDWIIAGGESGPRARPANSDWFRFLRDECLQHQIPFLFKQWGGLRPKDGGRTLDGKVHDEYPKEKGQKP